MTEKFESGPKGPEKPREYSAEEMQKIHQLAIKVRDLIGWDLGSMCSDSEEIQEVNDAKDAIKEMALPTFLWVQTKFTTVEEDGCPVMLKVSESSRVGLD